MKYTFVLYLVFVCKGISGTNGKSEGGETKWPEMNERLLFIINGTDAKPGEIPWFVSLLIRVSPTENEICGGSILNPRTIITAAHCTEAGGNKPRGITVRYDSIKLYSGGKTVEVDRIINNPMYGSNPDSKYDYDIALLITKTDIELNNNTVKVIRLPDSDPKVGTEVLVAGHGLINQDDISKTLKMVVLQIFDHAECKAIYTRVKKGAVTERQICTFTPGKTECQGDSGGPLTLGKTNTLVGVVSSGVQCASAKYPGKYTRVTKFLKFINDNKQG